MLTACEVRSQDTTDLRPVVFPFWMAKEVALDLSEKERLEEMAEITSLQLFKYQILVKGLEKNNADFALQVDLMRRKNELLEGELGMVKENPATVNFLNWVLRLAGAFGIGFFMGQL